METGQPSLPLRVTIPGLLFILGIELMALTGLVHFGRWMEVGLASALTALPWMSVLLSKADPGTLGYTRRNIFLHFGWGMIAGGLWRITSVLLNLKNFDLSGINGTSIDVLMLVIVVPFIEETFFRGYLGRSLSQAWGPTLGIIIQAVVFTLLPSHIGQGGWHVISIFAFGLLSGWLMEKRRSIWAAWGAHAFANLLPYIPLAIH